MCGYEHQQGMSLQGTMSMLALRSYPIVHVWQILANEFHHIPQRFAVGFQLLKIHLISNAPC
jgi:hypothetical protein